MKRLALFPLTTKVEQETLCIGGLSLEQLAEEYGTPLYVYDKATMDMAAKQYQDALASFYPGPASVTYAGKAFLSRCVAQWTQGHGLTVDCTGEGEMAIARAGGVPRQKILVHGVNKSIQDLKTASEQAGVIVVDNLTELRRIADLYGNPKEFPSLWLRLLPGLAVDTHHAHTQTGQHESKFGMTAEELLQAAQFCKQHKLPFNGIHFHQGSNFRDASPLHDAIEIGLDLAKEIGFEQDWHFCPGGGWGVAYHEDELPQPDATEYVRVIAGDVIVGCQKRGLSLPHLHLEPGRSLVARAGVAIYKVGAVKKRGSKIWALTDGGMTDNPRHALYGARYSCLTVSGPGRERSESISIAGPYCESGDVVIEDLPMPRLREGELIAIPAAGAYHLSMSSNYNGARKPAVLWLEDGSARVMMRRETIEDLLRREI